MTLYKTRPHANANGNFSTNDQSNDNASAITDANAKVKF